MTRASLQRHAWLRIRPTARRLRRRRRTRAVRLAAFAPSNVLLNDDLLNLLPKGVIAFPDSGITDNLVDKARQLGIPVQKVAA